MRSMELVPVDKMETYRNLKICLPYPFMHQVRSSNAFAPLQRDKAFLYPSSCEQQPNNRLSANLLLLGLGQISLLA